MRSPLKIHKAVELELSAANELYRLYGEFFAVWKLWNYHKLKISRSQGVEVASEREAPAAAQNDDIRWDLMKRAALVDAGVEALLVKVTSERVLTEDLV